MNIKQTKSILITELLAKFNIFPAKISGVYAMYFAINREESEPSLSIHLKKNTALDFGTGNVYDAVSLVQEIKGCTVSDALKIISEMQLFSSFQEPKKLEEIQLEIQERNYKILEIKNEISHPALIQYLQKRKVWKQRDFLKEIHYEVKNSEGELKKYFAVGFANNSENSFEISSIFFKGCLGKKDITFIENGSKNLKIFEGFFDFLSFKILLENNGENNENKLSDYLVLNSISMIEKSKKVIEKYQEIELFLDNDKAGDFATREIIFNFPNNAEDKRLLYKNYKDLNKYLCESESWILK